MDRVACSGFFRFIEAVDDDSEGAVAGHVAGGAEVVHGDVEGNHESLLVVAEAKHGVQHAEGCHDGAAGHAGGGDHDHTEHQDEAGQVGEFHGITLHEHECYGAGHNLEGAAREVDGGAERHHKAGHVLVHAVGDGLAQGHGDGGGAGLGAKGGDIGGQHAPEHEQRVLAGNEPCHAVLEEQHPDVQQEDNADDLDEDVQDAQRLSGYDMFSTMPKMKMGSRGIITLPMVR